MDEERVLRGPASPVPPSPNNQEEEENHPGMNGVQEEEHGEDEKAKSVSFRKLFSFADSTDILLMIVGTVGAIGNGMAQPMMTILLGDIINSFGQTQGTQAIVDAVSKVRYI